MPSSLRARISRQTTATRAMGGKTTGRKNTDRKSPMALSLRFSSSASAQCEAGLEGH